MYYKLYAVCHLSLSLVRPPHQVVSLRHPRHAIAPPLGHPALPARASGRHGESKALWKRWGNKLWGIYGKMRINGILMGINGILMGINGILMGCNGD